MSEYKKTMIDSIHRFHRKDLWVNELFDSFTADMENVDDKLQQDYNNLFFDRLDERACEVYEKDLALTPRRNSTLDDRRRNIAAAWLAKTFASLPVIQSIAEAFYEDAVKVTYDGDAELTFNFTNTLGTNPFYKCMEAVDKIKPAHIGTKREAHLYFDSKIFAGTAIVQHKSVYVPPIPATDTNIEETDYTGIGMSIHKKTELLPAMSDNNNVYTNQFAGICIANYKNSIILPKNGDSNIETNGFIATGITQYKKTDIYPAVKDSEMIEKHFAGIATSEYKKSDVLFGDTKKQINISEYVGSYSSIQKTIKILPI